jgi:hypothetical protein
VSSITHVGPVSIVYCIHSFIPLLQSSTTRASQGYLHVAYPFFGRKEDIDKSILMYQKGKGMPSIVQQASVLIDSVFEFKVVLHQSRKNEISNRRI